MLSGISPLSILIILLIVALLFGTKKLRGLGGDLGNTIKNFKKSMQDESNNDTEEGGRIIEGEAKKEKDHES